MDNSSSSNPDEAQRNCVSPCCPGGGTEFSGDSSSSGFLPVGAVVQSPNYPTGRSVVVEEVTHPEQERLVATNVVRDWEYVAVAQPVDVTEKVYEVPTTRKIQTLVPKVQVREVVRSIPREETRWEEVKVDVPHSKTVDRYVEVPVVAGEQVRYVPKVEVRERLIETTKTEVKWVEQVCEIPRVLEAVRYVESDSNVEQVIRYVPKGYKIPEGEVNPPVVHKRPAYLEDEPRTPGGSPVPLSGREGSLPPSPRLENTEHLFIPRVAKTVEVAKEVPVTVDVPVPFIVPKPVEISVDVPVVKFQDSFVPVPIRRHVIPRIVFTDQVLEVECVREKPVLVVEDYYKPVPVDAKIRLKERDIKVIPMDPAELSQADTHAMWMRVNADLLDQHRDGHNAAVNAALKRTEGVEEENEDDVADPETSETRKRADRTTNTPDFGPLPLHPGHPLMLTYLQSQWIQNPSTVTHNMYLPEFFRLHASAVDTVLHPQPHQVNLTPEQAAALGPLPAEAIPSPWNEYNINLMTQNLGGFSGSNQPVGLQDNSFNPGVVAIEALQEAQAAHQENIDRASRQCSPCSPCSPCCSP